MMLEAILSLGLLASFSIFAFQSTTQLLEYSSILKRKQEAYTIIQQRKYLAELGRAHLREKRGHFSDGKEFLLQTDVSFYPPLLAKNQISVSWEQKGKILKVFENTISINDK